ncbi:MAG TPA: CHAD domain-containing protein [Bryobacteraceae bacterium]|jgi:CHAD domain-containing protein
MALDHDRLLKPVKKLRKLLDRIDSNPDAETVHSLRTNSRRFEAMFKALSLDTEGLDAGTLKDLGRLRKRAGKVRDMDVLTRFASTVHPRGEEDCTVQLLEYLGAERKKEARKLAAEVNSKGPSLRKGLKRSGVVVEKLLRKASTEEATADALKFVIKLDTPQRLSAANLHPYRLQIKELQDVLRMASSPKPVRFVDDLGKVKDAIGTWHDWEELLSIAQNVLDHKSGCGLQAELKRITKQKYDHALASAQTLRNTYLRSAPGTLQKVPRPPVWEAIALLIS